MFILDMYRFCESKERFGRQEIAKFIFAHRECDRMARAAGVTPRWFASACSKEFISRMMSDGYLDGVRLSYWCKGGEFRPFNFAFRCFDGESNRDTLEMMNIGSMSDAELFGKPGGNQFSY